MSKNRLIAAQLEAVIFRATMLLEWDNAVDERRQWLATALTDRLSEIAELERNDTSGPELDTLCVWGANDALSSLMYGNLDQLDTYKEGYELSSNERLDAFVEIYGDYMD